VIRLQAGCLGNHGSVRNGLEIFLFSKVSKPVLEPIHMPIQWIGILPRTKWLVRKADCSPPSSAEVKNWWSYALTVPYTFMVCTRVTTCTFLLSQKPCRSEWKWNSWLHINMCEMFGQTVSDKCWNCAKTWETQVPPALFSKSVHQRQVHSKIFTIHSCNLPNNRSIVSCKVSFPQSVT